MMLQTKCLVIRENKRDRGETCEREKENRNLIFFWNRLNVNNEGRCK